MEYIQFLLPIAPFALAATVAVYAAICLVAKNRREKPGKLKMFAEFVLVGWVCMFVCVTQIMNFGNGMGGGVNLVPFGDFAIAFRYGSNNARLVWQTLLNVVMVVPLGFLLPVVFPKKIRGFWGVLLVSFGVAFLTEAVQLVTGRGSDIDDVIANTVGGLCGFAVFAIIETCAAIIGNKRKHNKRRGVVGILVLCLTASPFVAVHFFDNSSEFGNFYYGHNQPSVIHIPDTISREESAGAVYKATPNDLRTVEETLNAATGIAGEFGSPKDFTAPNILELSEGAKRVFISKDYNTWNVEFHYGEAIYANAALLPAEEQAITIAWETLALYGINSNNAQYIGLQEGYGDNMLHLKFTGAEELTDGMVYGDITVTIGENGEIFAIADRRVTCAFVKTVACVSPYEAAQIAQKIGVGEWAGAADVLTVASGYSLIEETGYVVPTWVISAAFTAKSGESYDWNPVIEAIK